MTSTPSAAGAPASPRTIQATDQLTITPSVFRQETEIDGTPSYLEDMGDLRLLAREIPEEQTNNFTLSAVEVKYDFGNGFELFSATSYFESLTLVTEDLTYGNTAYYGPAPDGTPRTTWAFTEIENKRFSEEIRLSYRGDGWGGVIGAFYLDEDRDFWQDFPIGDLGDIYPDQTSLFTGTQNADEQQVAVFGEASFDVTDAVRITAGARWFDGKQRQLTNYDNDPLFGRGSDSAVSPKLQLDYHAERRQHGVRLRRQGLPARRRQQLRAGWTTRPASAGLAATRPDPRADRFRRRRADQLRARLEGRAGRSSRASQHLGVLHRLEGRAEDRADVPAAASASSATSARRKAKAPRSSSPRPPSTAST